MSKPLFGQILDPDFKPTRDAVHIPIVPVFAEGVLLVWGGDRLVLRKEGDKVFASSAKPEDHSYSIADPFIQGAIEPGQLFYAWLKPESTQKLWHQFTHKELDK
jgi:hypothetical protein